MDKLVGMLAVAVFGGLLAWAFAYGFLANGLNPIDVWTVSNWPFPIGWILLLATTGGFLLLWDREE